MQCIASPPAVVVVAAATVVAQNLIDKPLNPEKIATLKLKNINVNKYVICQSKCLDEKEKKIATQKHLRLCLTNRPFYLLDAVSLSVCLCFYLICEIEMWHMCSSYT